MYIQFTKDINKIRNVVVFGMGFRDIIIFALSGIIAFLAYHMTKRILPNGLSLYIIIPIMAVATFFVYFHKNGMKFEKVLFYKAKRLIISKSIRRFQTENLYAAIETKIQKEEYEKHVKKKAIKNTGN